MDTKNANSHITLVGSLHIGYGALYLLVALIVFLVFKFAFGFVPELDEEIPQVVLDFIISFVPGIVGFLGIVNILAGISVFSKKEWSRIFMIVVSALKILNIPIGTALGVYSIWALVQPEVQELFE